MQSSQDWSSHHREVRRGYTLHLGPHLWYLLNALKRGCTPRETIFCWRERGGTQKARHSRKGKASGRDTLASSPQPLPDDPKGLETPSQGR